MDTYFGPQDFGDGFDLVSLIDDFTTKALSAQESENSQADSEELSCKTLDFEDLERALQTTTQELFSLEQDVTQKLEAKTKEWQRERELYLDDMKRHTEAVEEAQAKLQTLDNRISSVSHTAVRIGHLLESVDQQKEQNQFGMAAIKHFLEFNRGHVNPIFEALPSDRTRLKKAASLIQALQSAVQTMTFKEDISVARSLIDKTSNSIENRILDVFQQALNSRDTNTMALWVETLLAFRGQSVVQRYIFHEISLLVDAPHSPRAIDPNKFDLQLRGLKNELVSFFEQQVYLVQQVFPEPTLVLKAILERVFQEKVEIVIHDAIDGTCDCKGQGEDYLLLLDIAYSIVSELKTDIQGAFSQLPNAGADTLALAEQIDSLFAKYRTDYIEVEGKVLIELIDAEIQDAMHKEEGDVTSKNSANFFKRFRERSNTGDLGKWMGMSNNPESLKRWIRQSLACDTVEQSSKFARYSIARATRLSDSSQLSEDVDKLASSLLSIVGEQYLSPLLKAAAEYLPQGKEGGTKPPDLFFFEVVLLVNKSATKLREFFLVEVAQHTHSNSNVQTVLEDNFSKAMRRLEVDCLKGMNVILTATVDYASRVLSRARKDCYKPRDDTRLLEGGASSELTHVVEWLQKHYEVVVASLEGRNLDQYLSVLAKRVWGLLETHLRGFQVSNMGAALFRKDIRLLKSCLNRFACPAVADKIEEWISLSAIFFVTADNLPSLLSSRDTVSSIKRSHIAVALKMREDYYKADLASVLQRSMPGHR